MWAGLRAISFIHARVDYSHVQFAMAICRPAHTAPSHQARSALGSCARKALGNPPGPGRPARPAIGESRRGGVSGIQQHDGRPLRLQLGTRTLDWPQAPPSTVRPLARDPRVLIGWPFPLGFGLDGRLLLARRGRVVFNSQPSSSGIQQHAGPARSSSALRSFRRGVGGFLA